MYEPLMVRLTTSIYGQRAPAHASTVELTLANPTPTARDLITAHVSASFEHTLACRSVGAALLFPPERASRTSGSFDELATATTRAWTELVERRTLLVIDGKTITDLNTPLHLNSRSEISLMQVLPLLIGG